MKRHVLELRLLLLFIVLWAPGISSALKIDDNHYRFCVMDDAFITDADAAAADRADRLPFILDAYWYSYNGVMIDGTEDYLKSSNSTTSVKVLMSEPYDGNQRSLRHSWGKGMGSYVQDETTYIYISVDAPTGVSFNSLPSTILVGDEKSIETTLLGSYTSYSGKGYFDYSYSSSDPEILSVSSGKITAKNVGHATVTVKVYAKNRNYSGSYYIGSASAEIDVVDDLSAKAITLEPQNLNLSLGQEATVSAIITPKEAETNIIWKSSDENIVEVDNGNVKAVGKGTAKIIAETTNGLTAECAVTVSVAPAVAISDINCSWGTSRDQVAAEQDGGYFTLKQDESSIVYKKVSEDQNEVYLSYKFDKDGKLCASALSMPENKQTKRFSDEFFAQYDADISIEDGVEVKTNNSDLIAVDISTALNGGNIITLGLSYYEPMEERDDCVDLGLSVRWATTNLGAAKPTGVGDFYAFSETKTKSEYWRENYSYCNNNSNQYIFVYNNPETNICGTKYDVATKQLGEGWKMPSLAEANELISKCTWENTTIDGVEVYRVTGPNGNSIILPVVSWKKQRKEYSTTQLHLGIGECPSKGSEDTYILTAERNGKTYNGSIAQEWKAWGYNIRPVYTK